MKKNVNLIIISAIIGLSALNMNAQNKGNVTYQHNVTQSQAKMIEVQEGVVILPKVGELKMLSDKRVSFEKRWQIDQLATVLPYLSDFKISALAATNQNYDADVMVGALFQIDTENNGTTLKITVTGFPAQYVNFRNATAEDTWMSLFISKTADKYAPNQIKNL